MATKKVTSKQSLADAGKGLMALAQAIQAATPTMETLTSILLGYLDYLHIAHTVIPSIRKRHNIESGNNMAPLLTGTGLGRIAFTEPVTLKQFVDDYHDHRPDDWLLALFIARTLQELGREAAYQSWVVILKCRPDKQRPRTAADVDMALQRDNPYMEYGWYREIIEQERKQPSYGVENG